ncbi:MAG: ribbon-helix-helix domain-containing protein [Ruminococcus flavefaciens]|nr:ribbon-helix-helix domain-containing protein [Ruminococcus flavefaciens]MCM1058995.1 ribbon-helix-helix domain-containing protein [Eubacterium sp.]
MKRSVYSLVLSDDVIKAVDKEAYRRGTSRSNLINQILAEQLSCITPEMRMRDIFDAVSGFVNGNFQIQQQRSASLLTLRTALEYKYRPTINYKVELERSPEKFLGTLKVQIRTQSENLIEIFNSFFVYRIKFEMLQLAAHGHNNYTCDLSSGLFTRKFLNGSLSEEQAGMAISRYLTNLNDSIQIFFSAPQNFSKFAPELENDYKKMLKEFVI